MIEEQLEFAFMKNTISSVTSLGYIGGQDEDLGGYCEPLVILYEDGMEQYVLHEMGQSREGKWESGYWKPSGRIIANHQKLVFNNESALLEAWKYVRNNGGIPRSWKWEKTSPTCDCDATTEEFYRTKNRKRLAA